MPMQMNAPTDEPPLMPPRQRNWAGRPRHVGVEIEFAGLPARDAAALVQELFGGEVGALDGHSFEITGTSLGDFTAKLDARLLHAKSDRTDAKPRLLAELECRLRDIMGNAAALVVPCEVVCPPVPVAALHRIEGLVSALRGAGALGTERSPFYAFGAHLNPDIADTDPGYLAAVLKAYLLLSDWLRAVIAPDVTRRLLAFASPFPSAYAQRVVAPDYWPDLPTLIDDYLVDNPTRNRELDLLPLFTWLDEARVRSVVSDALVKGRPTFHYRLPDALVTDPGWSLTHEWNRWLEVERLAEDRARLAAMARAFSDNAARLVPGDWAAEAERWLAGQ